METDSINDPKDGLNESLLDVEFGVELLSGDSAVIYLYFNKYQD